MLALRFLYVLLIEYRLKLAIGKQKHCVVPDPPCFFIRI